jgi:hypothetical protein
MAIIIIDEFLFIMINRDNRTNYSKRKTADSSPLESLGSPYKYY